LRCGISVSEFWDLTPQEVYWTVDAAVWRDQQTQRQQIVLAWRIAALTRAKKLPSLKQMLAVGPAKPLVGAERVRRKQEFQDMAAGVDLAKINEALKKKQNG
jgi:hypothetical protein